MYCCLCKASGKNNALAVGTDNFRTSTLLRHVELPEHQTLAQAPKERQNMASFMEYTLTNEEKAIWVAMATVFFS